MKYLCLDYAGRMLRLGTSEEKELRRQLASPHLAGKWLLKWHVCVCLHISRACYTKLYSPNGSRE